jgi:leucyl-tRNA synthetase
MVRDYGCDALRLYELFIGPPELDSIWDDSGIDGVYRFICKFWTMATESIEANVAPTEEMLKVRNRMIDVITNRLESFNLNTVISGFMEFNNKMADIKKREGGVDRETIEVAATLLAPFAPHIAEELWERLGHEESIFVNHKWPVADEKYLKDDEIKLPVQVNGKTKCVIEVPADISKDDAIAEGKKALGSKLPENIIKEIYVPGRIVNIVAK